MNLNKSIEDMDDIKEILNYIKNILNIQKDSIKILNENIESLRKSNELIYEQTKEESLLKLLKKSTLGLVETIEKFDIKIFNQINKNIIDAQKKIINKNNTLEKDINSGLLEINNNTKKILNKIKI